MSIKVEGVSKYYGKVKAVNQVSFEIASGEIVGFLGPNGAGKSTLMRIIAGYMPPSEGRVEINGMDVFEHRLEVGSVIGYLPENNPLYTDMYVKEYLGFVAGIFKLDKPGDRVRQLVEQTGLGDHQRKRIRDLSKGYRQRVGLAQALINNPDVLILDEPISGLDPNQLVEIRALIKSLGSDKAVLFSSHILQEVEAVCDRLLIINQGNLLADDSVDSLRDNLSGAGTVILVCHRPVDKSDFENMDGVQSVEVLSDCEIRLRHALDQDITERVFKRVVETGNTIREMRREQATVEQVFRLMTN